MKKNGIFSITIDMCLVKEKEDGSFIQICNCKHGSDNCKNNE